MADASLGTAVLRTRLDTTGLKTGLDQAKSETQKFGKDATSAVQGIGAAFGAVAASQGLRAYVSFMRSAATEAVQAATAADLFEKAIRRNNESVSQGADMVDRLSNRFGVANNVIQDAATTMLRQGATIELVEKTLLTAGASAAAAGVDIATAFDNVTTAVVSGNSVLLRSSGIIAGLGQAEREYAREIGKTVEQLTEQEKLQARVNAIYEETRYEIEDLDRILEGLPRAQAEVTKQWTEFRKTAGGLAATVITPITQGLGTLLRLANELPAPLKNAAITMTGVATAGATLATGITAIRAALTGLSGLGLLSFGPAGWVVLGITAVAGLAAALAGGNNSLTSAIDEARAAIASGDKDSMIGALDAVTKQVNGPTKEAFVSLREELITTGDVGVEQAQRILMHMQAAALDAKRGFLGTQLFGGPSQLNTELARAGGVMGVPDLSRQIQDALNRNELVTAIDLLNDAMVALDDFGLPPRMYKAIADFHADVANITSFSFTPTTAPGGGGGGGGGAGDGAPPPPGTTPPGVTPPDVRTAKDVWTELGDLGLHAINVSERLIASGVDETEATIEQLSTRRGLLISARDELLHGFYDDVTDAELEYLQNRITAVDAELAALRTTPRAPHGGIVGLPDALDARASSEADAAAGILVDVTRRANVQMARDQMEVNARNREAARAIAADTEQAMADAAAAHEEYLVSIGHTDSELERFRTNADNLATALKKANDETARQALFADAQERYGTGDTGLAGTSAAARGAGINPIAEFLRQNVLDAVEAVQGARAGTLEHANAVANLEFAVNALTTVTPMSVLAIEELTEGLLKNARAAERAAAVQAFDENPGLITLPTAPRGRSIADVEADITAAREQWRTAHTQAGRDAADALVQSLKRELEGMTWAPTLQDVFGPPSGDDVKGITEPVTAAADQFEETVIKAGLGFADTLVQGIKTGDLGSIVSGAFGAGSSIIGAIPGIGTLGTIISGLLPIFGGLLGGLVGGGQNQELERRRQAEASRARSVPAININFTVTQHNQYNGAPSDPRNEQAFARQADQLFESLYKRHLGPRLESIERRLGMTGAGA